MDAKTRQRRADRVPEMSPDLTDAQSGKSSDSSNSSSKKSRGWIVGLLVATVGLIWIAVGSGLFRRGPNVPSSATIRPIPAQYDGDRAFGYLTRLCDFGPRPSGSEAMRKQQEYLKEFFTGQGGKVSFQTFDIRHPVDGSDVALANLVASWNPGAPKKFLVCAHYDTRPFPDRDAKNPKGVFVGANDGASGTAGLMELSHQLSDLPANIGVDLVLFDAEEFVFRQGQDDYFLGSTFFAKKYASQPPTIPYTAGILLDMIGDKELTLYYERNSLKLARSLTKSIWKTADRLGVRAFISRSRANPIDDDHIPLNNIAKIPTADLIDFDYPRPGIGQPLLLAHPARRSSKLQR